jgi:methionyl-tRNA formyltransferase
MSSHRVVFFGTPKIAASCLQALIDKKINVIGVVCRGDKPQGRDYKIVYSEVKNLAIKYHLPLFQPHKISEITQTLKDLQPDLIITCAYGGLVPESILTIPKYKCVNAHASLLPR